MIILFAWKGHPSNGFPLGLLLAVKRISPRVTPNFRISVKSESSISMKPTKICYVGLKRRFRETKFYLKRSFWEKEGFHEISSYYFVGVCFWRINEEDHMRIVSMQKGDDMQVKNNITVAFVTFVCPIFCICFGSFSRGFREFFQSLGNKIRVKKSFLLSILRVLRLIMCLLPQ